MTMKRNTLGRSAGGLSSVKAPPARPTGLHARYMHEKRQLLRGTYLPLRLPVHPSVRPCRPFGLAFSDTRRAFRSYANARSVS